MVSKFDFRLDPAVLWAHGICLLISTGGGALALPTLTPWDTLTEEIWGQFLSGIIVDSEACFWPDAASSSGSGPASGATGQLRRYLESSP